MAAGPPPSSRWPDGEGFLHPDLYEWRPGSGEMRRITRQADLRDPDPSPDGSWAVAVRDRFGLSQLVTVDLASGETRALTDSLARLSRFRSLHRSAAV